jgi:hypothetical protein
VYNGAPTDSAAPRREVAFTLEPPSLPELPSAAVTTPTGTVLVAPTVADLLFSASARVMGESDTPARRRMLVASCSTSTPDRWRRKHASEAAGESVNVDVMEGNALYTAHVQHACMDCDPFTAFQVALGKHGAK